MSRTGVASRVVGRRGTVVVPVAGEGVVSEGGEVVGLVLLGRRSELCYRDLVPSPSCPTTQQVFVVGLGRVSEATMLVRRAPAWSSGDSRTPCLPGGAALRLVPVRVPGVEEVVVGRVWSFAC